MLKEQKPKTAEELSNLVNLQVQSRKGPLVEGRYASYSKSKGLSHQKPQHSKEETPIKELESSCTLCNKLYIGETGRRLGDRFHLRDVKKNEKDASRPVARHFNLPNHSKKHMAICDLSLHLGTTESRKNLEQKFIFQIGTLNPHGINERFSFN